MLNSFMFVVCTTHLMLKFPVKEDVGEVQQGSRCCYVESVKVLEAHKQIGEPKRKQNEKRKMKRMKSVTPSYLCV